MLQGQVLGNGVRWGKVSPSKGSEYLLWGGFRVSSFGDSKLVGPLEPLKNISK